MKEGNQWSLPHAEQVDDWLAYAVGDLTREVKRRVGLDVTFLRELGGHHLHTCLLENHSAEEKFGRGMRWCGPEELDALPLAPAEQRTLLRSLFREWEAGAPPPSRAQWEREGWLAQASEWILQQVNRLGAKPTGPLVQFKAAWNCSCILRLPTADGDLYFKAGYTKPPAEASVIELLSERWRENVPVVVAAHRRRRWLLMPDFGGQPLDDLPARRWADALALFARIQIASSLELPRWRAIRCPNRSPAKLPTLLNQMLSGIRTLDDEQSGALDAGELKLMQRKAASFERWCGELDSYAVPPALVNEDLRASNIRKLRDTYLFFDWTDTVIAHPFVSAVRFLDFVQYEAEQEGRAPSSTDLQALRDAYLEPWTSYEPMSRLRAAFALVQKLNPFYLSVRWYSERPYLDNASVWGKQNSSAMFRRLRQCLKTDD